MYPFRGRSRQITIHQILTLDIPQGSYSACYDIDTQYLGVTKDATMAVELSSTQFQACQEANGQFCSITTPFQPLGNPPSCIAAFMQRALWISPQNAHCRYAKPQLLIYLPK